MPKTSLDFGFFLRRQSKSKESALFRLHILEDLLGNKRSWFVICDWWISIRFFVFLRSLLLNYRVRSRVFEKRNKFYLYSCKFFDPLYTETWQV